MIPGTLNIYPDTTMPMHIYKRIICLISLITFLITLVSGQQIPQKPVSYRVFTPFLFNPAITGSHDYSTLDITTDFQGESNAQLVSLNARLTRKEPGYFSSPDLVTYRNTGVGGYLFHEKNTIFQNSGAGVSFAYHIPLNRRSFSFLAFGIALKGYFSSPGTAGGTEPAGTSTKSLHSNMDLGMYYYGTHLFAGFSSSNVFGSPQLSGDPGDFLIPVSRQYALLTGYKIQLSKSQDILLEPSIISIFDSLTFHEAGKQIRPVIKLYIQNFCMGTYFHDKEKNSFFFQYRYPRFYVGGFFALPKKSPYYSKDVIVEIMAGINFSSDKSRFTGHSHW